LTSGGMSRVARTWAAKARTAPASSPAAERRAASANAGTARSRWRSKKARRERRGPGVASTLPNTATRFAFVSAASPAPVTVKAIRLRSRTNPPDGTRMEQAPSFATTGQGLPLKTTE